MALETDATRLAEPDPLLKLLILQEALSALTWATGLLYQEAQRQREADLEARRRHA